MTIEIDDDPRLYETDYPYDDLGPLKKVSLPMPIHGAAIDVKIERFVRILRYEGIQTDQSCEGGTGHISRDPMVRFNGTYHDAMRALKIAKHWNYDVMSINKVWYVNDGELQKPQWIITLYSTDHLKPSKQATEAAVLATGGE